MSTSAGIFTLQGSGWAALESADDVRGEVLVQVTAGGKLYNLATTDLDMVGYARTDRDADLVHFVGAVLNDPQVSDKIDYKTGGMTARTMTFEVSHEHLPFKELRNRGVLLQASDVRVLWTVVGAGLTLDQADVVLEGKMSNPVHDEEAGTVSFTVRDARFDGDKLFPPVAATSSRIANLDDESIGKPYPIIVGTVKKSPCLYISNDWVSWLAMHLPFDGGSVDAIYDGDTELAIDVQGSDADNGGDTYYYVDIDGVASTKDVTVDATGYPNDSFEGLVGFLMRQYSNFSDKVDYPSLSEASTRMLPVNFGVVVNEFVDGGALNFVQSRIVPQVPVAMFVRGGRIAFRSMRWDRDVSRYLKTGRDIISQAEPFVETPVEEVCNEFVVRYGRSAFRNDATGVVEAKPATNFDCQVSLERYGLRAFQAFDVLDVTNEDGALYVLNWLVETFSKVRVKTSYLSRIGSVVSLGLWDTVRVEDEWNGLDHAPLFKVIGARRMAGPHIKLDLISVDDYLDVFNPSK